MANKVKKEPGKTRKALAWAFVPFANVFSWIGLKNIIHQAREIKSSAAAVFVPQKPSTDKETFEQAMIRLNLSEQDIQQKQKDFLRLAIIFASIGVVILCYALYIAWFGAFGSFLLAFVVSLIALAMAFRHHFWWFQVKKRKLGCTIKEWLGEEK